MRDQFSHDPYTAVVQTVDSGFMLFYRHARRNARRITNLVITLVPLMALLVGSCKTAQTTDNLAASLSSATVYSVTTDAEQLQTALFPDQAAFHGAHYVPAAGYVEEARNFVEEKPQTMMMLTRDQIGYMFGKPSFHRHDADAEVWQYKTAACVVDFYFYGKSQVSYIDTRHKDQTPATASEVSSCLHHIEKKDFDNASI
jgi:hypothetical protein